MDKERSGKPLDGGSLQPTRNDEDLGQSTLTEAHGEYAGGQSSPWESRNGKRKNFLMNMALMGKLEHSVTRGNQRTTAKKEKVLKHNAGPALWKTDDFEWGTLER